MPHITPFPVPITKTPYAITVSQHAVPKPSFNPLAPTLGGRIGELGDTPKPSAGSLLHLFLGKRCAMRCYNLLSLKGTG